MRRKELLERISSLTATPLNTTRDLRRKFATLKYRRLALSDLAGLVKQLEANPACHENWHAELKRGRPKGANTDRDRSICEDYSEGVTVQALARKHYLSPTRVGQIIARRDRRKYP